jgi:hypothetical protein
MISFFMVLLALQLYRSMPNANTILIRASSFEKLKRELTTQSARKRQPDPKHGWRFEQSRVGEGSGVDRLELYHIITARGVEDFHDLRTARPFGNQFTAGSIAAYVEARKVGFERIGTIELAKSTVNSADAGFRTPRIPIFMPVRCRAAPPDAGGYSGF